MRATKLSSALVPPSKIASILDWRRSIGAVIGFDITMDKIGVAVVEHPEIFCHSTPLESISLNDKSTSQRSQGISTDSLSNLESIVKQHRVCAFVVNWPVNEGRMGEHCGKVLQVLDSIIGQSNNVVTKSKPFTLWSVHENAPFRLFHTDEWGRSADFAKAPVYNSHSPDMRYSSKSVLRREAFLNESLVAANVLDDWIKNNWEIDFLMGKATAPKTTKPHYFFSMQSVDEYQAPCLKSTLL